MRGERDEKEKREERRERGGAVMTEKYHQDLSTHLTITFFTVV